MTAELCSEIDRWAAHAAIPSAGKGCLSTSRGDDHASAAPRAGPLHLQRFVTPGQTLTVGHRVDPGVVGVREIHRDVGATLEMSIPRIAVP